MVEIVEREADPANSPVDGRAARRQRNIEHVLDVVIDMFVDESMFPTMEQVAIRSGLSLRSLYRYFAAPPALLEAAIARTGRMGRDAAHLPSIGQGPLERRIDDFVTMRLRIHDAVGAVFRATVVNAPRSQRVRDQLTIARDELRRQFEAQFAPEIATLRGAERDGVVSAGDLLTQLESIDFLRRHRRCSVAETSTALATGLRALFG